MSELSIKVNIAGRTYPLTIKLEEEEVTRKAADRVNQNMKKLQDSYKITDKIDLLAMTALQFANQSSETEKAVEKDKLLSQLNEIDRTLSEHL